MNNPNHNKRKSRRPLVSSDVLGCIIQAIVNDIKDRQGLRNVWREIKPVARKEIMNKWASFIQPWL
jgi:hypothetical protein